MHAIYDGDAAREAAHLAKTTDVGREAWRTPALAYITTDPTAPARAAAHARGERA